MNRNDERLLSLVGCIRGAVIELDGEGHYLNAWVDDESLLTVPLSELLGRTVVDVLGEAAGRPLLERVRRVHATGNPERFEYALSIRGRRAWFMSDFKRVKADEGHTVLLFRHDITERKQAEEALRLSEERYRLAAEATNDILYDWDLVANSVTWGPSMRRVLGHDDPPIQRWVLEVHPDDQARLASAFTEALASADRSWQSGYRARRADGTYAELLDRGFIMRDSSGRAIRLVGSLADVTQLNRLQAQLVQSDRLAALGTLAAGVGHEINNPLCFVIGNLDLAIASGPHGCTPEARAEEEETRSALMDAREGATRIVEIVKGLRLFSRSDVQVTKGLHVEDILEASLRVGENEIRHRARVTRAFGPTPPVDVSEAQLGQVCLNLIVNAAQAIPQDGRDGHEIGIVTGTDERGRAFFSVSDTGGGIAPEHI